jgi:hypothetical protein
VNRHCKEGKTSCMWGHDRARYECHDKKKKHVTRRDRIGPASNASRDASAFSMRTSSVRYHQRRRFRFPPPPFSNSLNDNQLPDEPSGLAACGQRQSCPVCHSLATADTEIASAFQFVAAAWPDLPPHIREAILALVNAACPRLERGQA